jgi:hypothetical protein
MSLVLSSIESHCCAGSHAALEPSEAARVGLSSFPFLQLRTGFMPQTPGL